MHRTSRELIKQWHSHAQWRTWTPKASDRSCLSSEALSFPALYLATDRFKSAPLRELSGKLNASSEPPKENTVATELQMCAGEAGNEALTLGPGEEISVRHHAAQPPTSSIDWYFFATLVRSGTPSGVRYTRRILIKLSDSPGRQDTPPRPQANVFLHAKGAAWSSTMLG